MTPSRRTRFLCCIFLGAGGRGVKVAWTPAPGCPPLTRTHVMTAVSSRKAWAVTSHLMFFTATFCPRYSPCRTAGGRWGRRSGPHRDWTDTGTYPLTLTPKDPDAAVGPQAWKPLPYKLQIPEQRESPKPVCKLQPSGPIQSHRGFLQGPQAQNGFLHF